MLTFLRAQDLSPCDETSANAMSFQIVVSEFAIIKRLHVHVGERGHSSAKILDGVEVL